MNEPHFKELIDRYLAGTASKEDLEQLDALEGSFPQPETQTLSADTEKNSILKERIYRRISRRIHPQKTFRWLAAAAAVAALIVITGSPKGSFTSHNNQSIAYSQVKTSPGSIKEIVLSDGSTVILNAGSTLYYPASFKGASREVKLIGLAFFKVKHNTHQPFLVHTATLTTRVLGTTFDVYAYAEAADVRITLATGRIQIARQKANLATLKPNQQLLFNKATNSTKTLVVNSQDYTGWKTGQQLFKQSRLDEVALYLNKWYGLNIAFNNQSLKDYRITTRFTMDMPAKQVLDIIAASSCAQYAIHDHKVTFSGNGCRLNTQITTLKPSAM